MQKDDSRLRVRRFRERQRAAGAAATVTADSAVTRNGDTLFEIFAREEEKAAKKKADGRFGEFWDAYPRKRGKLEAERAWAKAVRTFAAEDILSGLRRQLSDLAERGEYCPYPATWLNQGRWMDEPEPEPVFDDDLPF